MPYVHETWLAGMADQSKFVASGKHFTIELPGMTIGTLRGQHSVDLEAFLAAALDKVRKFNSTLPGEHEALAIEIAADELGVSAEELAHAVGYVRSQETDPWTADEAEALR